MNMNDLPWMQIRAVVPEDIALDVVRFLMSRHGFIETDWLVLGRRGDKSRFDYDPCPPPGEMQVAP